MDKTLSCSPQLGVYRTSSSSVKDVIQLLSKEGPPFQTVPPSVSERHFELNGRGTRYVCGEREGSSLTRGLNASSKVT